MLYLDVKVDNSIRIGDIAVVTVKSKSGQKTRLGIEADKSIKIEHVIDSPRKFARQGLKKPQF